MLSVVDNPLHHKKHCEQKTFNMKKLLVKIHILHISTNTKLKYKKLERWFIY